MNLLNLNHESLNLLNLNHKFVKIMRVCKRWKFFYAPQSQVFPIEEGEINKEIIKQIKDHNKEEKKTLFKIY